MNGQNTLRVGFIGIAAVVLVGGVLAASQVWAAAGTASVESAVAAPGEQVKVDVGAFGVTAPGLGAWSIDIKYDAAVVTAVGCNAGPQPSVCNAAYAADTVRLTGASAGGLMGDTVLGNIVFECGEEEGVALLELSLVTFADATVGGPQDIDAGTGDGTIDCIVPAEPTALPATGSGSHGADSGLGWLIAGLTAAGVAGVFGVVALRMRARHP